MHDDPSHREDETPKTPEHAKDPGQQKPRSERATHQGGGGVNKDHKPHGGGPIATGEH